MALQKQGYNISFGLGIETKVDPNQVPAGKMLALENVIFNTDKLLAKRNGFGNLTTLPVTNSTTLATLNDSLVATGLDLYSYSPETNQWNNQGIVQPVALSVQPLLRKSQTINVIDSAVSSSGVCCVVYTDTASRYIISNANTGQQILESTDLPATAVNPKVVILGTYFLIVFVATVAGTKHLQYIRIPINNPSMPSAAADISTQVDTTHPVFDCYVAINRMYVAWNASDAGDAIRVAFVTANNVVSSSTIFATFDGDLISITADETGPTPIIYVTWRATGSGGGYTASLNQNLIVVFAPVAIVFSSNAVQITSSASDALLSVFAEAANTYSYVGVFTNLLQKVTVTSTGVVSVPTTIVMSLGLGSKAFFIDGNTYMLATYQSANQSSYFLINSDGAIIAKLAYANGAGYISAPVLPTVSVYGTVARMSYLIRTLLVPVNKSQGATNINGKYNLDGINLVNFDFNVTSRGISEIAGSLNLTGGILWQYDGIKPVEQGFNVWPEDMVVQTSTIGGNISSQLYYYVAVYEWTDAAGNIQRSAPSIPFAITTTGPNTSSNTVHIPTLRITYKVNPNPVRIVLYRWSVAQQTFYQITSLTNPLLNNIAVDDVSYVDTLADADITGNPILYTTGGVIENIGAPGCDVSTLYKSRLFIVDAEDKNLLWYSKQVIEATPVEMSDLLTIFIAPTSGAQGSTGNITALSVMDDKLIIFKRDAIYYITGNGPDNTGANNDFSEPVYITGTVGCNNPVSIILQPQGIMFQSDKGIWLLGRDLSTTYIGAPVQKFNSSLVKAALTIPGTNQVRFTMDNGVTLMYDYYQQQWGTFNGIPGISSTLYKGLHTSLNSLAIIQQETPGTYLDGAHPVLISFTSAWIKLTELQGFQRAYQIFLLSNYLTPHKLNVNIVYDYGQGIRQNNVITPTNFSLAYGLDPLYGNGNPYGGPGNIEQWRIFLQQQKCQSFQISVQEMYDPSQGIMPGAGLTMSGMNLLIGTKSSTPKLNASQSVG